MIHAQSPSPSVMPPSVLIVDYSEETREVLRTALARRGVATLEAQEARQGLDLMRAHHPEVVVFDLESQSADDEVVRDELDWELEQSHASLIVLGRARRYQRRLPEDQVLAKPYHFGPLIRTIERLCEQAREKEQAREQEPAHETTQAHQKAA